MLISIKFFYLKSLPCIFNVLVEIFLLQYVPSIRIIICRNDIIDNKLSYYKKYININYIRESRQLLCHVVISSIIGRFIFIN